MAHKAWPKILPRRNLQMSPWVTIVEREIEFAPGEPPQIYHAISQPDYVVVLARTTDGRIPLVRQYRPAVEGFTLELPSGNIDAGEDPVETCRRELQEETGFTAAACRPLGISSVSTVRMSSYMHAYFADIDGRAEGFTPEPGVSVELVSVSELVRLTASGEFCHYPHVGVILVAMLAGLIDAGSVPGLPPPR